MQKTLHSSLPLIADRKYLTSDNANEEFKKVYEHRREDYNGLIKKYTAQLEQIEQHLKDLEKKERKEIDNHMSVDLNSTRPKETKPMTGNGQKPVQSPALGTAAQKQSQSPVPPTKISDPSKVTKPDANPRQIQSPDANIKKADLTKDPKPIDKAVPKQDTNPKTDIKQDHITSKPDTSLKSKKGPNTKDKNYDPLSNINKPKLDPKMEILMPIYQERRKLKQQEVAIREKLREIHLKKISLLDKEKELQVRQNILKSIHISPEKLHKIKETQKSSTSLASQNTTASHGSRSVNIQSLKQLKRGFYLDLLEITASQKTYFTNEDRKYNIDKIMKVQKEHQDEVKLKYSQAYLKAKTIFAMRDPDNPENSKFLKESAYYQLIYSDDSPIRASHITSKSPEPKESEIQPLINNTKIEKKVIPDTTQKQITPKPDPIQTQPVAKPVKTQNDDQKNPDLAQKQIPQKPDSTQNQAPKNPELAQKQAPQKPDLTQNQVPQKPVTTQNQVPLKPDLTQNQTLPKIDTAQKQAPVKTATLVPKVKDDEEDANF